MNANAAFFLNAEQIEKFEKLANSGDGDAAFKLSQYYSMCTTDDKTGEHWLRVAASLNNEQANENLKFLEEQKARHVDSNKNPVEEDTGNPFEQKAKQP